VARYSNDLLQCGRGVHLSPALLRPAPSPGRGTQFFWVTHGKD